MRDPRELEDLRLRVALGRNERMRTFAAAAVGAGALLGVAALVVTALGSSLRFDAGPPASTMGIAAALLIAGCSVVVNLWTRWSIFAAYRGEEIEVGDPEPSPVPERERMRASQARAVARRVEARRLERQRAARNHTAASGGNVSSTEAGLPPQGSSEATTEP